MNDKETKFYDDIPTIYRFLILIGLALILIGVGDLIEWGIIPTVLGFYTLYKAILELTETKKGFNMPNVYKILIVLIICSTLILIVILINYNIAILNSLEDLRLNF